MKLSHFVNVIELDNNRYLLLKPRSPPIVIDEEALGVLKRPENGPQEVINLFKKYGIITELKTEEEIALLYGSLGQESQSSKGRYGIAMTYNCNFACIYCYERKIKRENTIRKELVDRFYEIAKYKLDRSEIIPSIGITGGEPLLDDHEDILEYILRRGSKDGFVFDIISNGYMLSEYADLLSKYNVKVVKVTIDGPKRVHNARRPHITRRGTFDRIIEGIKAATQKGIFVTIFTNIDSQNIDHIPQLVNELREEGVNTPILLKRVNERSGARYPFMLPPDEYFQKVLSLLRKYDLPNVGIYEFDAFYQDLFKAISNGEPLPGRLKYCGATNGNVLIFDPRGDLYPCDYTLGNKELRVGTYYPEFKLNRNYLLWINRSVNNIPQCFGCKLAPFCAGGCPMEAYNATGTFYSPYCSETKYLFEYIKLRVSKYGGMLK